MDDQKYLTRVMTNKQKIVDAVEKEGLKTPKEIADYTKIGLRAVRRTLEIYYKDLLKPSTKPHIFWTLNLGDSLSDNYHTSIHSFAKKVRQQCKDENLDIPSISTISNKARAAIMKNLELKEKQQDIPDIPIITIGDYDIILLDIVDKESSEYKTAYSEHQRDKLKK